MIDHTLLPLPIEKFVPEILKKTLNDSDSGTAFVNKIDEVYEDIILEILEMYWFKLVERCPKNLLNELGYFLASGIKSTDTERNIRVKIKNSVRNHKNRGLWEEDAQIKIENITGYIAGLYTSVNNDDCIEMGYTLEEHSSGIDTYYWSTENGYDGLDDELGTLEVGSGLEIVVAGNIAIDCHVGIYTPVLSANVIEQIVAEIEEDVTPAYMRVMLGYIDTSGQFQVYYTIE
jgi:hypothetical protein